MSKGLEIVPIKDKTKLEVRQSPTPHLPRTPLRMLASAASFSGKSTTIANMILNKRMYRDVWDSIWIFSQSVDHDGTWGEVKKYVRESLNKDPSKHFFSEWDGEAIRKIISDQAAIVKFHKDEGHKKSHQILLVIDDFADRPEIVHQSNGGGILNSLFTRGRHFMISTLICKQKPTLISTTIRENATSLIIWKQRSSKALEVLLSEYDAMVPGGKASLFAMYEYATKEPYAFLLMDLLRPSSEAFFKNFNVRLVPKESA